MPRPSPTVYRSHLAHLVLEHAARRGIATAPIAGALGIAAARRDHAGIGAIELSFDAAVALADVLARACAAPLLGLDVAAQLPRGAYGIVEYVAASAPTIGDALATVVRCHALGSTRARVALWRHRGTVTFEHWVEHPAARRAIHGNELALATYVAIGTRLLGGRPPLRAVRFMHEGPAARRDALAGYFGAPVELGAPRNALVFDDALLAARVVTADPALFAILAEHAERDAAALEPCGDLVAEARETYRRLLVEAPLRAQAAEVADALAISTRSLQRRLAAAGRSFRAIEAEVKQELALAYLRDPRRSIRQIARLVGFGQASAFVRAFRRWTGATPGALRAGEMAVS